MMQYTCSKWLIPDNVVLQVALVQLYNIYKMYNTHSILSSKLCSLVYDAIYNYIKVLYDTKYCYLYV